MKPAGPVLGIFVGGRSRRMGGQAKGLLPGPDGRSLLARLVDAGRAAGCEVVLVGDASPYDGLVPEVPRLPDDLPAESGLGWGPLGGLSALLRHADPRPCLAVACDMPYVDDGVLRRLLAHAPGAAVLAARRGAGAPWEPLLARYRPEAVRPVLAACLEEGVRSFQGLFARLEVTPLALDAELERALTDWDSPDDVASPGARG